MARGGPHLTARELIASWLGAGVASVEPERLTREALSPRDGQLTVFALGKAAAAMCRGAGSVASNVDGLCITNHPGEVPPGIELVIGDHPVPSTASLSAGRRALEMAPDADIALISGGGSALCEVPSHGLDIDFLAMVNQRLLASGTGIIETNLVRSHLSLIKGGGLGPIDTYILSDVAGAGPEIVSSGPTMSTGADPEHVLGILDRVGVDVDSKLESVIRRRRSAPVRPRTVEVIGDGRLAADAVAAAATSSGLSAGVRDGWIDGDYRDELEQFISSSPRGVTVGAGEPSVPVEKGGRGGRNTHTALAAAAMIANTGIRFAALATDGADGNSGTAGAIVDGATVQRGGDPSHALDNYDSATYLGASGEVIETGPTGTNVADLWLIWKPEDGSEPILTT